MAVVNERPTIRNVPLRLFGICKPEGFYLPKKSFSYEVWVLTRRARKEAWWGSSSRRSLRRWQRRQRC